MKLIREEIESVEFLVEQKNGKKSMYIEGVFLQGNIKNRNGRMYPMEALRKEVGIQRKPYSAGGELGELGHPDGPTVNLEFPIKLSLKWFYFVGKPNLNTPIRSLCFS